MFRLPPLPPSWDAYHPLVVHFPIGLLFAAPVLVVLALVAGKHEKGFNLAALAVMILGTIGVFVAVSTGDAAESFVNAGAAAETILDEHEEAAEASRIIFSILTVLFAVYAVVPMVVKKPLPRAAMITAAAVFLAAYGVGTIVLANTGHYGAQLVHEFGVQARFATGGQPGSPGPAQNALKEDED